MSEQAAKASALESRSSVDSRVRGELKDLRTRALELVSRGRVAPLHAPYLEEGGKMLRPRLLFLAVVHAEELGCSADFGMARDAALAIELCHVGSLYHDDVVDRSPIRRGAKALHLRHGARAAAVAGAQLVSLGNRLAAGFESDVSRAWGNAGIKMTEGQLRDIERTGAVFGSIEDFVRVCSYKTGAAFELAAQFGAAAGNLPDKQSMPLIRFARHVGIAFQLFDDLNDFVEHGAAHRPKANDLRERVYSLPVLFGALRQDSDGAEIRRRLRNDGRALSDEATAELCELLADCGAFEEAARRTAKERSAAIRALEELAPTEAREELRHYVHLLRTPAGLPGMSVASGT